MRRKVMTVVVLVMAVAVAWLKNNGISATEGVPTAVGSEWKVPTAAELDRMRAEKGMKASAAEIRKMQAAAVGRVVDGDTVELLVGGDKIKARLLQVNTPETVDPRRPVQAFGQEASTFTKTLLPKGARVSFRYDVEKLDRYGRHLVHLYLEDGTWLNALLVRAGYAQVATYPPNVSAGDFFRELQERARRTQTGLWQIPENRVAQ